jgi:hypothetical protein
MKDEARIARYIPPKRRLSLTGIHGVMSQKTELFIVETDQSLKRLATGRMAEE